MVTLQKTFLIVSFSFLGIGCAGPYTPFGAVNTMKSPPDAVKEANAKIVMVDEPEAEAEPEPEQREPALLSILVPSKRPSIQFQPDRQVLHGYKDWHVQINDVETANFKDRLKIIFNKQDVTARFLSLAKIESNKDSLKIMFPKLSLPYDRYNQIEVQYLTVDKQQVKKNFLPPVCSMYDQGLIANTGRFKANEKIIQKIHEQAAKYSLNPRMMAGIIGQESSFNPNAVSWAKAIGLTQVTPIAEAEIIGERDHYPRYPALNDKPVWKIKTLIEAGKVNPQNEWRLDPLQSIEGGLAYLDYVDNYWRKEANAQVLTTLRGDPYIVYTQVVLASYNSGPYRVKRSIERLKDRWILHAELKEAHKYVNRIFSFCHHFGETEVVSKGATDDSST